MRLERVSIKGYRSIRDAELADCGSFNVLIGKNNSGKSNVLSSVSNFFACLRSNDVVQLSPPAGAEVDFFERDTATPITVKLVFSLAAEEWDGLKADLLSETPQMRHAVEVIAPEPQLAATVSITRGSAPFGYLSRLELESGDRAEPAVLFSVDGPASLELYGRSARISGNSREISALRNLVARFDADDWQRLLAGAGEGERPPLKALFRRGLMYRRREVSDDTLDKVGSLLTGRPTFEDFQAAVKGATAQLENEAREVEGSPLKYTVHTFSGDADTVPIYVRNLIRRLGGVKVLHLRELRRQIGREEAARLLSLKVKRGGRNVLSRIEAMIQSLLGVQVDAFEGEPRSETGGEPTAELDVDNFLVEVNGSGIREALRLILDIEFEQPQIILVEEPEVHLHPALETSMMQYLRSLASDRQVFISTHSTNFLDTAQMRNIYLVSKNRCTVVDLLDREQAEERLPRELGIRLSSIFLFDRLLLVEGPTDEDILRAWAGTLNINFNSANLGFLPIGGVRNIQYFASASTLSFLTKRRVSIMALIDRDERDRTEIRKLTEALGARATPKVLERREIENYLACPEALSRFIAQKQASFPAQGSARKQPSIQGVKEDLAACIQALKPRSIDLGVIRRLCDPIYLRPRPEADATFDSALSDQCDKAIERLEKVKSLIQSTRDEVAAELELAWAANPLAVVPGGELLDCVCQQYGVRFKKELDGVRLASLMKDDEIDGEIKAMLSELSLGTGRPG
jgi:hypothetical protein